MNSAELSMKGMLNHMLFKVFSLIFLTLGYQMNRATKP